MSENKITLISSNDERFEVSLSVAHMSKVIAAAGEDDNGEIEKEFHCLKVSGPILKKVVDFCRHFQEKEEMEKIQTPLQGETLAEIVKPAWFAKFCEVEREILFDLVAAANYLDISPLLDLTCLAVSVDIKGKSVEELRKIFNLPTPEGAAPNDEDMKDSN